MYVSTSITLFAYIHASKGCDLLFHPPTSFLLWPFVQLWNFMKEPPFSWVKSHLPSHLGPLYVIKLEQKPPTDQQRVDPVRFMLHLRLNANRISGPKPGSQQDNQLLCRSHWVLLTALLHCCLACSLGCGCFVTPASCGNQGNSCHLLCLARHAALACGMQHKIGGLAAIVPLTNKVCCCQAAKLKKAFDQWHLSFCRNKSQCHKELISQTTLCRLVWSRVPIAWQEPFPITSPFGMGTHLWSEPINVEATHTCELRQAQGSAWCPEFSKIPSEKGWRRYFAWDSASLIGSQSFPNHTPWAFMMSSFCFLSPSLTCSPSRFFYPL